MYFTSVGASTATTSRHASSRIVHDKRHGQSCCRLTSGYILLFGGKVHVEEEGAVEEVLLDDLLQLDLATLACKGVRVQGSKPAPRAFHTANALGNRMVVFGGSSMVEPPTWWALNDLWMFKSTESFWERCCAVGEPPPARAAHSAVMLTAPRAALVVFGGTTARTAFSMTLGSSTLHPDGGNGSRRARRHPRRDATTLHP